MARRQDLSKRTRILEAAFITFRDKGYKDTTIKDVADIAGVAAGSIYTYFLDKESLFQATVEEGWNRFILEVENAVSFARSYEDRINILLEMGFLRIKSSYNLLQEIYRQERMMDFFRTLLDRNCKDLVRISAARAYTQTDNDYANELSFVRLITAGVFFLVAVTRQEDFEKEIPAIKSGIRNGLFSRRAQTV